MGLVLPWYWVCFVRMAHVALLGLNKENFAFFSEVLDDEKDVWLIFNSKIWYLDHYWLQKLKEWGRLTGSFTLPRKTTHQKHKYWEKCCGTYLTKDVWYSVLEKHAPYWNKVGNRLVWRVKDQLPYQTQMNTSLDIRFPSEIIKNKEYHTSFYRSF